MHSSEHKEKLERQEILDERYKGHVIRRWVLLSSIWAYVLGYVFELYMRYFG
jgi:hypothetical protein